jgi:hypothetical protein
LVRPAGLMFLHMRTGFGQHCGMMLLALPPWLSIARTLFSAPFP